MVGSKYQFIIMWPYGIDIIDWADNLIIDFPEESIPILTDPEDWVEWAATVSATGIFAERGVPSPIKISDGVREETFENWEDWAKSMYSIMIIYNKN